MLNQISESPVGLSRLEWSTVVDHLAKARAANLPHVKYFDEAYQKGWLTPESNLMSMVEHLMKLSPDEFASKEWKYSEWAKKPSSDPNPTFGST